MTNTAEQCRYSHMSLSITLDGEPVAAESTVDLDVARQVTSRSSVMSAHQHLLATSLQRKMRPRPVPCPGDDISPHAAWQVIANDWHVTYCPTCQPSNLGLRQALAAMVLKCIKPAMWFDDKPPSNIHESIWVSPTDPLPTHAVQVS